MNWHVPLTQYFVMAIYEYVSNELACATDAIFRNDTLMNMYQMNWHVPLINSQQCKIIWLKTSANYLGKYFINGFFF